MFASVAERSAIPLHLSPSTLNPQSPDQRLQRFHRSLKNMPGPHCIPRHRIPYAIIPHTCHGAALRCQQPQWHPHITRAPQGIGHRRTALSAEVVPIAAGFDPAVYCALLCLPLETGFSDDRRAVITRASLSAAQRAVAPIEIKRLCAQGESHCPAQALSCQHFCMSLFKGLPRLMGAILWPAQGSEVKARVCTKSRADD